jgi:uncharacterized protein (DUF362 family)
MDRDQVIRTDFIDYESSINELLDKLGLGSVLSGKEKIVIKPNLLDLAPHPCTTDPDCVNAIIKYIRRISANSRILIIEGSGGCSTKEAFRTLVYNDMAEKNDVEILDVDDCQTVKLVNKNALVYKEINLPEIIFDSFFISVPCLKDHLISTITIGMKNLVGLLPEEFYGKYWSYKRSDVHRVGVNNAIVDLNNYIKVNLTVVDGRIGQFGSHMIGGRHCSPAKNILFGGYDVLEVDKSGAQILGHDWTTIKHLKLFEENIWTDR